MSRAKRALRKEKLEKKLESGEITREDHLFYKHIKRDIRNGVLPAFHFKKNKDGTLPKRKVKRFVYNDKTKEHDAVLGGLSLISINTLQSLTKK